MREDARVLREIASTVKLVSALKTIERDHSEVLAERRPVVSSRLGVPEQSAKPRKPPRPLSRRESRPSSTRHGVA
jgi:hypothetical protein